MKRTISLLCAVLTAAGILAALGAGITVLPGCDVSGCSNPFDPSDNEIEGVYGPPGDYDPSDNEIETVYGPPEYFGLEEDDEFDPSDNELEDVYGPPPDEEDSYQPEDNIEPPVYGPPEGD